MCSQYPPMTYEKWNHFDKENCFKLVKSMSERIKVAIKARDEVQASNLAFVPGDCLPV